MSDDRQTDARLAYIAYRSVAGEPFLEWDELGNDLQSAFADLALAMDARISRV